MRQEILNWLRQAESDMDKAQVLSRNKNYDGAVFYFQQSVEKALKSLFLVKFKEIPKGHSIIYFAQKLGVAKELLSGVRDLNPEYLITRYPDMAAGIPAELYDENIAKKHEKTAVEILKWAKKQIQE